MKSILIANRGEIALRIARTVRKMGYRTVCIHSRHDSDLPFVKDADTAVLLEGETAAETYLNIDAIIKVAKEHDCAGIHPGYGFLSENAAFARRCESEGIVFIGPSADVIEMMGDKITARNKMQAAGVPVVPGSTIEPETPDADILAAAEKIGFPVMIKASAGGGGKGMRMVEKPADFIDALAAARREAGNAFGDDSVFLEKFIVSPRHIEVQVFGCNDGKVLHLYERECSIQRRHQKIIEESPSPFVTPEIREKLTATAVKAAEAVGYTSAGTVEFIMAGDGSFYFLEMNTRLQVEHPVTEMTCSVDLVEWMINTAFGQDPQVSQEQIIQRGHAIEARLYAEDPSNNFLPASGPVHYLHWPLADELPDSMVRYDSGVEAGNEVSIHYDPMIAKVAVWALDRPSAASLAASVLRDTVVFGLTTNRFFLYDIIRHKAFLNGDTTTGFIEEHYPNGFDEQKILEEKLQKDEVTRIALAAALFCEHNGRDRLDTSLTKNLNAWETPLT